LPQRRRGLPGQVLQLGRLLDPDGSWPGIPANTTIIVVGDNGTPSKVTTGPFRPKQMKGTLYEGGVNVPLIIRPTSGWTLGAESDALVHAVDLFGLVLDLTGATPPQHATIDSQPIPGFDPVSYSEREWVLAERGCNARAVRDERYKLIDRDGEAACPDNAAGNEDNDCDQFFDLETDPFETDNLLPLPIGASSELQQIYADLREVLDDAEAEVVEGTPCYGE
jgi:arylsulfatase A-like enzyme